MSKFGCDEMRLISVNQQVLCYRIPPDCDTPWLYQPLFSEPRNMDQFSFSSIKDNLIFIWQLRH